ncbi:MAG: hypothetical protein ABI554_09315 [Flavobacterium sp.]
MKKKLILMLIFSVSLLNAQDVSESDVVKIIEKDFLEIPKNQLERLVPYTDNNSRTGLMDFKTRKIIVPAKYFELDFFKPNLKGNYNGIYLFEYNPDTKKIDIHLDSESVPEVDNGNNNPQKKDKPAEMNGFSLTDDKKLKNYSNSYSSFSENLFFYNDKYYGIAVRDQKYGIVDQDGKPLSGFDFNYGKLELNVYSNKPIFWFKFLKVDGTSGFINQKGEIKFVNEFKTSYSPKTSTSIYCASASEEFSYHGYEILYSDEGAIGVLDLENMKWVVKSSKERDVIEINYASNKKIENIKKDRNNIKLYFLMYDKKLEKKYYIDESLVEYKFAN